MNLDAFLSERSQSWDALDRSLARARGRPERLGPEGVLELGDSYRAAVADLALARRRFPGDPVVDRLEGLVARARLAVYHDRRRTGRLWPFLSHGYWRLIRERPGVLAASLIATFVPALVAGAWAVRDPGAAIGLVPSAFRSAANPHVHHIASGATTQALLSSSIFTNNIRVAFLVFAGGLLLGAGSIVVLAYNGILLGALAGLSIQAGSFSVFVRYVAPHGLLELSCFAVAGAAGMRLGWALIDPGLRGRGEELRRQARPAVAIVLGTAPWLIVAGLVEGFITPDALPEGTALALGLALAIAFWSVVFLRGRPAREQDSDAVDVAPDRAVAGVDQAAAADQSRARALALR